MNTEISRDDQVDIDEAMEEIHRLNAVIKRAQQEKRLHQKFLESFCLFATRSTCEVYSRYYKCTAQRSKKYSFVVDHEVVKSKIGEALAERITRKKFEVDAKAFLIAAQSLKGEDLAALEECVEVEPGTVSFKIEEA